MERPLAQGGRTSMYRPAIFTGALALFCAAHDPARALELCEALEGAADETRAQISGFVTSVGTDAELPYLFVEDETGECEILVEVVDNAMLANCAKESKVTAIGVLRWDEEAAYFEDVDVNLLDDASVVCE